MKKFIILLILAFVALAGFGQRGVVKTITLDTVKGNENVYFTSEKMTGSYDAFTMQLAATKISSAAGGTASFEASVDGANYTNLYSYPYYHSDCIECWFGTLAADSACSKAFANVTTQTFQVKVKDTPWKYYRWLIDGDADDTMAIKATYIFK